MVYFTISYVKLRKINLLTVYNINDLVFQVSIKAKLF